MKTIQQSGQVFILADVDFVIAHFIGYSSSIAINSTRLKEFFLETGRERNPQSAL